MTRLHLKPRATALIACALSCLMPLSAADTASEIEQLRQLLADQQRQINELRQALEQKDSAASAAPLTPLPSLGQVASTAPVLPRAVALPAAVASPAPQAAPPKPAADSSPLQLKIGDAYITPVGFMDMTLVSRSTGTGNALATNFGNIPFANTAKGSLTETRLTAQNSRIGVRVAVLNS